MVSPNALLEPLVLRGVSFVEWRTNHGDRAPAFINGGLKRLSVDAFGKPGNHNDPSLCQLARQTASASRSLAAYLARADDRNTRDL